MKTIVIGFLNTDIIATGLPRFPKSGELIFGDELSIGPGGKSRNIASMIARLVEPKSVAMLGRTSRDPYGLWKSPVTALEDVGVDTSHIKIFNFEETGKMPGIALIPVDINGNNQIIVLPGICEDFCPKDIEESIELFKEVGLEKGMLVLTMECPIETSLSAVKISKEHGIKVMFDPGGLQESDDITELLNTGIFLIKPNEHELKMLTGINAIDFETAQLGAKKLFDYGIENVLITLGEKGAFLFTHKSNTRFEIPNIEVDKSQKDATGCGDQTMATLVAMLQAGKTLTESVEIAIKAGTLQFFRTGIKTVELEDL